MSTTNTEVVRTQFVWDTSDVDKGVKRIETALDRAKKAEDGVAKKGGSHGGGGNFANGVRDLAEGRGVNAMQRFGHTIGATAGRLAIYMLALKAAGAATKFLREELDKTDEASRRLETQFTASSRAATFSTSANKPEELSATIGTMNKGFDDENAQQGGLQRAKAMLDAMHEGNPLSRAAAASIEAVNAFQGKRTPDEEISASETRQRAYAGETARLRKLRSSSYGSQADLAEMNAPGGNPYEAKRRELELQQRIEVSQAKAAGVSKEDLTNIARRYDILRQTAHAEEQIFLSRNAFRNHEIAVQHSAASRFSKSVSLSNNAAGEHQRMMDSGLLTEPQRLEEMNARDEATGANRDAIMGRYLNPDGSRRRAGAIHRDFRNDRNSARRRARFQRAYDRGGFDPATGRRRTARESGLHSGGLSDGPAGGGLVTGGLVGGSERSSGEDWRAQFTPKQQSEKMAKPGERNGDKNFKDLYDLLNSRLPQTQL